MSKQVNLVHLPFVGEFFGSAELVEVMLQVTCLAPRPAASVSIKLSSSTSIINNQ